jgi:hypothetical protein
MEENSPISEKKKTSGYIKYLCVLVTIFVLIVSLSVSYYYIIELPKYNRERIKKEEQTKREINNEKKELEFQKEQQENRLQECLNDAKEAYWTYIKLNGREVPGKPGVYSATTQVWETAERNKKNAIDVCLKRFGK